MNPQPSAHQASPGRFSFSRLATLLGDARQTLSGASSSVTLFSSLFHGGDKTARRLESDADRTPLDLVKLEMFKTLDGCSSDARRRIHAFIARSASGKELWMLRSGIFQVIAIHHGEAQARARINALLPLFARWIPEKQRVAI